VLTHARALLTGSPEGVTSYIDADLRDPSKILREAARILDSSQPVGIMLIAIMHLIVDADGPYEIVGRLMSAVPAGSYLAPSQVACDIDAERMAEAARRYSRLAHETQRHRTREEVTRSFDGLDLVDPGVVGTIEFASRRIRSR
jgi:S-adenosyl methyltransferase